MNIASYLTVRPAMVTYTHTAATDSNSRLKASEIQELLFLTYIGLSVVLFTNGGVYLNSYLLDYTCYKIISSNNKSME